MHVPKNNATQKLRLGIRLVYPFILRDVLEISWNSCYAFFIKLQYTSVHTTITLLVEIGMK
jgi:hypothetical protein